VQEKLTNRFSKELRENKMSRVEVITGPMFCGKSDELIRRLSRVIIAKREIQVFKPRIDDKDNLASHSGQEFEGRAVSGIQEIKELLRPSTEVVAIDGAHLFEEEIIPFVQELAEAGKRVIVAGLDTDFRFEPFGAMPKLIATAEVVDKLPAICMVCGKNATRTQRLVDGKPANYDDPVVVVGANEMYEARCRMHHKVPKKR